MSELANANLEIMRRLFDAFNDHDLDKVMSYFSDHCTLDMPRGPEAWGARYVGKSAVRGGLATRFEMVPDVHYSDGRHWATDNMGVSEWLLTGTSPAGSPIRVRGCDHYEFDAGKVVRKDSYWKIVE